MRPVISVREDLENIIGILRNTFDNVLITGSVIMRKIFNNIALLPEETIEEAEGISSTFKRVSVLTDNIGFMNSLGSLLTMKVRGGVVVIVYDVHDIRPLCSTLNIPCLEPWDSGSLMNALIEGRDYSESFELPYIIRIGPWLMGIGLNIKSEILHRGSTFNKNWGEPLRWGLDRLIRVRSEPPIEIINRANSMVYQDGSGERVLALGSAWSLANNAIEKLKSKYTVIRTLYAHPLPNIDGINYVLDVGNYASKRLGINRLLGDEIDKRYSEVMNNVLNELFFRRPGDPLMLIEWAIYKSRIENEVPIVTLDVNYSINATTEGMGTNYDLIPTFYEVSNYSQVIDIIGDALAAAIGIKVSGYDHGRIFAVVHPCSLTRLSKWRGLIDGISIITILMDNECPELLGKLNDLGIKYEVINYDADKPLSALNDLTRSLGLSGIIVIKASMHGNYKFKVIDDYCDNCGDCLRIGCPAITIGKHPVIKPEQCVGCGICQVVCERGSIIKVRP